MFRFLVSVFLTFAGLAAFAAGDFAGTVVAVDDDRKGFRLDPEGEGEAFFARVGPGDLAIGYEGERVTGVVDRSASPPRLERILPANPIEGNAMRGINRRLIREAASLGRGGSLARGDYLPDFAFYNQRGEPVFARDLRSQPAVLTFLFTRCPDPEMCPATAARLASLGDRLAAAGREDVRLVAVSFDPGYDTPGILRQYGEAMGLDTGQFELLTGDPETIQALLRVVGVRTYDRDGTIVHNLVTLLSDDHGRIVLRQDGSRWSADAIYRRLAPEGDTAG